MSNRSSSKQHCLVGKKFPKKTGAKKRNKMKAQARRAAKLALLQSQSQELKVKNPAAA